jgi:hypothetical protein
MRFGTSATGLARKRNTRAWTIPLIATWNPYMESMGFKNTGANTHDCHFMRKPANDAAVDHNDNDNVVGAKSAGCIRRVPGLPYNGCWSSKLCGRDPNLDHPLYKGEPVSSSCLLYEARWLKDNVYAD